MYVHGVPGKRCHLIVTSNFAKYGSIFQNSLTDRLSRKFVANASLHYPLKY